MLIQRTTSLVDSFARAGYVAVAPDLFDKKPKSEEPMAGFNATEFFGAHGPAVTDPKVEKAIAYMRDKMDIQKIASTGYCFGGRYAFRALGLPQNKGVQVAFAAHPTLLGDDEIKAIKGPASLALAGRSPISYIPPLLCKTIYPHWERVEKAQVFFLLTARRGR